MERPLRNESLRRAVKASVQQGLEDIDDGSSVCVVVPDATRPLAFSDVLSPLIEQLTAVASNIEIVVGLGLHRPMTPDESEPIRQLTGDFDIAWSQHDATADDLMNVAHGEGDMVEAGGLVRDLQQEQVVVSAPLLHAQEHAAIGVAVRRMKA